MKKFILLVLSAVIAIASSGCAARGAQPENVDISAAVDISTIKQSDYKNDLDGLEKYLKAITYIPENAAASDTMYNVIGAVNGHRFSFTVNRNPVTAELYEYDPDKLNEEATRVLGEVKSEGKFYVFDDKSLQENASFEATLSSNGKYLVIYLDQSSNEELVQRKKDFINAVVNFYK